jgi:pyridoxine 5-phosphate synthase
MHELNIGHNIIARSIFIGLDAAVKEILAAMKEAYDFSPVRNT